MNEQNANTELKTTALDVLHRELGGKMVPFAGYAMPVQYPMGIMGEHLHCRAHAGLFDVSHMGQLLLKGEGADKALEALVTGDVQNLALGKLRYSLFTNEQGGILDDLMITRRENDLYLVVNAAVKDQDIAHLRSALEPQGIEIEILEDKALLALQGPEAEAALSTLSPAVANLSFMSAGSFELLGVACWISRSGYTGEDGFEISLPASHAETVARALLDFDGVAPIGLGARDSLRLEAGLCLYGHDIDESTTPVEAALNFALSKRRREEGGFPGADIILSQLMDGTTRKRVGLKLLGRQPAREGAEIVNETGDVIGKITSGGFAPSVGGPIAMGYVATDYSAEGSEVGILVRGKRLEAVVAKMPFVTKSYVRKTGVQK
ncbi:MAG: glycine cleavage system aminomethyltransferase GcvT [Sphingomonadales bacterium]